MPTEKDEKRAMAALLSAHPNWEKGKQVSINQCLRCRSISREVKLEYIEIMRSRYPTSTFNFPTIR